MREKPKIIIFTDLDGTLLDAITYSYKTSLPIIKRLKKREIPIVFCTAKTKAENEYYQKKLKIKEPFIVENGGAIFIPKNYFSFKFPYHQATKKYLIIKLGSSYSKLRKALKEIREETKFKITGFGDMTLKEVAKDTGLPIELAGLAKMKEYNESFKFEEPSAKEKILIKKVKEKGFKITHGGRYYGIIGKETDKGKAVKILTELFKKEFGPVRTIGLGDSWNDLPMLKAVDLPILVQNKEEKWNPKVRFPELSKIKGIGPKGWTRAIKKFIPK